MNKSQILLIWDIDGTLVLARGGGRRAMDKAFLEIYGIDNGFEGIDMAGRLDALILKDAYALHNITNIDSDYYFNVYCKHLKKDMDNLSEPIDAPGILELLPKLSSFGNFYNVLGTGNVEPAARIKLKKHDMNRFFPTGGFGSREADRWQIIEEAIFNAEQHFNLNFEKENIYVIGDTPRDIECGKKLGIKSVGVATGMYSVEDLQKCDPDFVFEDFLDTDRFLDIFK
jgi:phosphoglycolate phosphatase